MSRSGDARWNASLWAREVLIPLLVDVPLWGYRINFQTLLRLCLNPSFSGCPALGCLRLTYMMMRNSGLNPSFSGCPALGLNYQNKIDGAKCLNPSFSGCPALGLNLLSFKNF